MERTLIAYALMALFAGAGIALGLFLRRRIRLRWSNRQADREGLRLRVEATAKGRTKLSLRP